MSNNVSYTRAMRYTADVLHAPLVTIDYDDRHLGHGCGRYTFQGQANSPSLAVSLENFRAYLEATCPENPALKLFAKPQT